MAFARRKGIAAWCSFGHSLVANSFMICRKLGISALALLVCVVPACGRAEDKAQAITTGQSSVWRVDKDGHHLYMGGTIHLLRKEDYPLPDVFEEAYRDSKKLVFELPPGSEGEGEVVLRMREMGSF